MMTRKAFSRQEETKLQLTLKELKASKELVEDLYRERDDNEKVLLEMSDKNSLMRNEMSQLHLQYETCLDERERLQTIVEGFSRCSDEYEHALKRITELELLLQEAHKVINKLENDNLNVTVLQNQSLFEELVATSPQLVLAANNYSPQPTIDLTVEDSANHSFKGIGLCSRNQLKKYIRINKFISKTQKLIHKNKYFTKKLRQCKTRVNMREQLQSCFYTIDDNNKQYDLEVNKLELEIISLEDSLKSMTKKYETSKKEINEYILALNELVDTCKYNSERFNSLVNNNNCSNCNCSSYKLSDTPMKPALNLSTNSTLTSKSHVQNNIVIFSDEIGKGLAQLVNKQLGQTVINYCMPGSTYNQIIDRILKYKFNSFTTLVILISNRGNVDTQKFTNYFRLLTSIKVDKIVMSTFPCSIKLPHAEKNIRYKLNLSIDTLVNNCDKVELFDINTYSSKYNIKNNFYSIFVKRLIAKSLYSYFFDKAKVLASQAASIEQPPLDIRDDTTVSIPISLN